MFRCVAVLFTIYIYAATAVPVDVRRDLAINRPLGFFYSFWGFLLIQNLLGRTEMRPRERKDCRYEQFEISPEKNCILRTATDRQI